MKLPIRPRPEPGEHLQGYLLRLAAANGYRTAQNLCAGFRKNDFDLTQAIQIDTLPRFSEPGPVWARISTEYHGLLPSDFIRTCLRWCPECMQERQWFRPLWGLKVGVACPVHCCWLQTASQDWVSTFLSEEGFAERVNQWDDMPQVTDSVGQLMTRLAFVLEPKPQVLSCHALPFIPNIPIKQLLKLIRFFSFLGASIATPPTGQSANLNQMAYAMHYVLTAAELFSNWPAVFWQRLDQMQKEQPDDMSLQRVFGWVHRNLYRELYIEEFDFLRQSYEEFLIKNWRGELNRRHRLFSKTTLLTHSRISLKKAAGEAASPAELRDLAKYRLANPHLFNSGQTRRFLTFDRNELEKLGSARHAYTLVECTKLLGLCRHRAVEFIQSGLLLLVDSPDTSVDSRWRINKRELEQLLTTIQDNAHASGHVLPIVTLQHVLRFWRIGKTDFYSIIQALTEGSIKFWIDGQFKLAEIKFAKADIEEFLKNNREGIDDWLSIPASASYLKLKEQTIYELVASGLLLSEEKKRHGYPMRGISKEQLKSFEERYISLSAIAKLHKTIPVHMYRRIVAKPVTGPSINGARQYFYERKEVQSWI